MQTHQFLHSVRNKLLLWARKERGPFYDPNTKSYHVDFNSSYYYEGYTPSEDEESAFKPNVFGNMLKPVEKERESTLLAVQNPNSPARPRGRPRKNA
ncbi:uncharacterized protein VTP21DRAFT_11151 [Calcarisporiella thermophila]|uniref:uncharacterized protein n=1 Tax=Calcarisporiella thermophila TaxID=911321 RepID=UPI0037449FA3